MLESRRGRLGGCGEPRGERGPLYAGCQVGWRSGGSWALGSADFVDLWEDLGMLKREDEGKRRTMPLL